MTLTLRTRRWREASPLCTGMKSRISATPSGERKRVRSTFVSGRYSCWLRPYLSGLSLKCPPFSSSRIEQNTLGESKAGKQSQSTVPSVPTSAAVCRSPITPWFSIGRYPILVPDHEDAADQDQEHAEYC